MEQPTKKMPEQHQLNHISSQAEKMAKVDPIGALMWLKETLAKLD
jgi:hypothetical protein